MKIKKLFHRIKVGKLMSLSLMLMLITQFIFGQEQKVGVQELKPSQTIEREMLGAETHLYKFDLKENEFFQVRVEQKGIDIMLKLLDVNKNVLATMDSPNEEEGLEMLSFIAKKTGSFILEVSGFDEKAEKGKYIIERKASRIATTQDKRRVEVERLFVDALNLRKTEQLEAAITKFEEAKSGWEELKDQYLTDLTAKQIELLRESLTQSDVRQLPVAEPFERQLKSGKHHFYEIKLEKGEVLRIDAVEKGINLRIGIFRIIDKQVMGISDFGYGYYREVLTIIAEQAGSYAVIVTTPSPKTSGNYQLTAMVKKTATEDDNEHIRAEQLFASSLENQREATEESFKEAIAQLKEASSIWKKLGEKYWEAFTYTYLGKICFSLGRSQESFEYHDQALRLSREVGDKSLQATAFTNMGSFYYSSGKKQETLEYFKQALPLFKAVGDKLGEANIYDSLGEIYDSLGKKQKALESYNQGLVLSRETGYKFTEANTLSGIGNILFKSGETKQALTYLKQSLEIWQAIGEKRGEAVTLNSIAEALSNLGEKQEALKYFNQSMILRRNVGDKNGEAFTSLGIAGVYSDLGEKQKELEYDNRALKIFRAIGNKSGEATALNNLGGAYDDLGEKQEALTHYNQALKISQDIEDVDGIATGFNNIGQLYSSSGDKEKALEFYNKALVIKTEYGDKGGQAVTLDNMGNLYADSGELPEALKLYNQALSLFREVGNKTEESTVLNNIGLLYSDRGETQEALKYFKLALPLMRAVDDKKGEAVALNNMMIIWESSKNRRLAIFFAKQSVSKYQQLRSFSRGIDYENQKSFLDHIKTNYQDLAELLIEEKRFDEAIEVLSLYQDQQFFDFNHGTDSPVQKVTQSPREMEFAERYEATSSKAGQLELQIAGFKREFDNGQLTEQEKVQLQKLEAEFKTATNDFEAFLKDAETEFSKKLDEKDKVPNISDIEKMKNILSNLDKSTKQKTAALYVLIGSGKLYILFIIPNNQVQAFESPINKNDFNSKIIQFYALLHSPEYDPRILGKELYDIILKPIEATLKKEKIQTLMWLLDGNLRYIPMSALSPDGAKYLVEDYQNVVFTRADKERLTRAVSPIWSGYGFSTSKAHQVPRPENTKKTVEFPSLDFGKDEMRLFRSKDYSKGSVSGNVFFESQFNKKSFVETLKQKRPLVHISSHFRFYPGDSTFSFLLLGDGDILTLSEMKEREGLFQGVELLTLSACDTAAQFSDAYGREIDGFAELAQRLGAASILATLWRVNDKSTAQLMKNFYINRQKGRLNKAQSLRKAQLDLLYGKITDRPDPTKQQSNKSDSEDFSVEDIKVEDKYRVIYEIDKKKPFAHPYYWSPFVLFGNWK